MMEFLAEYIAAKVEAECELNQKFTPEDLVAKEDMAYLTEEGQKKLKDTFEKRVDRSIDGIIKLHDTGVAGGIVYKKVAKRVKNTNYFANKVY